MDPDRLNAERLVGEHSSPGRSSPGRLDPGRSKRGRLNRGHSADVLDVLSPLLRVRPELRQVCRFGPQWTSDHAAETDRWAPFHLVTQGACVIELDGFGRTDCALGR